MCMIIFCCVAGTLGSGASLGQHVYGVAIAAISTATAAAVGVTAATSSRGTLARVVIVVTFHVRANAEIGGCWQCGWALRIRSVNAYADTVNTNWAKGGGCGCCTAAKRLWDTEEQ